MPIHELEDGSKIMVGPEVDEHFKKPGLVHFIGMLNPPRPGVADCFMTLEHTCYPPDTPKNDDFYLILIRWQEMDWGVVGIPEGDRPYMERAAAACGLRVADGIPFVLSGTGTHKFPVSGPNVFTLENVKGHPVYQGGVRR